MNSSKGTDELQELIVSILEIVLRISLLGLPSGTMPEARMTV